MTYEEKSQAQDVLDGLLRDSYQQGYNQGFIDGTHVGGSGRTHGSISNPPAAPTDGTAPTREGQRQQDPAGIKACLDCSHCHTIAPYGLGLSEKHICRLASKAEPDPVTGRMCYTEKVHCWKEREDGSCGPEGRNFEKKRGFFSLLFGPNC